MSMDHRTKEAVRYLGYGTHAVDDKTLALVGEMFRELDQTVRRRIVYRIFELESDGDDKVRIGQLDIASRNLAKNMRGCAQAAMLGATLGIEADMLMKRYSVTDISKAVVAQACAAAMLEEYLDDWQEELREQKREEGYFDIHHQEDMLRMLDSARKIGLTMTDAHMLSPSKSVTAVIGMSREDIACHRVGCEACGKTDCMYRRES